MSSRPPTGSLISARRAASTAGGSWPRVRPRPSPGWRGPTRASSCAGCWGWVTGGATARPPAGTAPAHDSEEPDEPASTRWVTRRTSVRIGSRLWAALAPNPAWYHRRVTVGRDPSDAPQASLRYLPPRPGVYLMKDATGRVLYVGEAASLRARVRQYFQDPDPPANPRLRLLVPRIADIDTIFTANEVDALILEINL